MPYLGNQLEGNYTSFETQTITGDGSTGYTLSNAVTNGKELLVYINNVKQEEGSGKSYTASGTTITFSDAVASTDSCYVVYLGRTSQTVSPPDGSLASYTGNASISGNVLVGTTSANPTSSSVNTAGQEFSTTGGVRSTVASNPSATFNRKTDDGEIVLFRKDGSTVGNIGVADSGDRIYLGGSGTNRGIAIDSSASVLIPSTNTGGLADGLLGLGTSTARFTDLFLSSGLYVGGTGSANHLDDYEEGTFTPALSINDSTSGITYASRSAEYVKIGKQVFVNGDIQLSSKGSSSGVVRITSLPFTINDRTSGTSLDGGASLCGFSGGTSGIYSPIGLIGRGGFTEISMYVATSSGGQVNAQLSNSNITDSFSVRFSLTYII